MERWEICSGLPPAAITTAITFAKARSNCSTRSALTICCCSSQPIWPAMKSSLPGVSVNTPFAYPRGWPSDAGLMNLNVIVSSGRHLFQNSKVVDSHRLSKTLECADLSALSRREARDDSNFRFCQTKSGNKLPHSKIAMNPIHFWRTKSGNRLPHSKELQNFVQNGCQLTGKVSIRIKPANRLTYYATLFVENHDRW